MILIADSGSTKTSWAVVGSGERFVTEGLNPHFTSDEAFLAACSAVSQNFQLSTFNFQLYFYGSGCGNAVQRMRVQELLAKAFEGAEVHVETDMLGACRAVSGHEAAFVAILGTGSNACYYDGNEIACQATSTGFILGDKGSANYVGRVLLNDYLTHHMPPTLRLQFCDRFRMSDLQLMDAVYHQPHANRFLASLAPFAIEHLDDEYCDLVIVETLGRWYYEDIMPLFEWTRHDEGMLHFVGSFAKAVEPYLRNNLLPDDDSITIGKVVADPMDGLLEYHSPKTT